jgi:hypothetical protein
VFRSEIPPSPAADSSGAIAHGFRNRLNKATLAMRRLQEQWQAGLMAEANETFKQILDVLDALDHESAASLAPGA